ncbi:hypothetical protein GOBAR_DD16082 [Gossypium barbadense]|nr:hypothetical protein GOBAR_DD16082 [Gossypium barbadense]
MSMVNGIPTIAFSDRIKDILFMLGRNIGYNVLHNCIFNIWKPAKSFHLMDITNRYFLVKFQDIDNYKNVLIQGPWIIFCQYLTVQPWTKSFNPTQPYPSVVMAWIRLSGLPGYLYKRQIIEAIGGLIGKVVKLDLQTDNKTRGCCGEYGHVKELCPSVRVNPALGRFVAAAVVSSGEDVVEGGEGKKVDYGPWMLVERKSRRGLAQIKMGYGRISGPSNEKLGGPREERPG